MRVIHIFVLLFFLTISFSQSQQPPPPRPLPLKTTEYYAPKEIAPAPAPTPPFVMSAPSVRVKVKEKKQPKTGYEVGVWLGANAIQSGNWKIGNTGVEEKDCMWLGSGIKFGYTWPFDNDDLIQQFSDEVGGDGLRLAGGLEGEAFWIGSRLRPDTGAANRKVDLDSAVFMLNFLLKAQAGNFRPYIGPGFGAAVICAHDYDVPGRTENDDSDLAFAFQTLGGCDYFVTHDWSVFAEYRFLLFHNADFYNTPVQLELENLEQHIFAAGVRYHF